MKAKKIILLTTLIVTFTWTTVWAQSTIITLEVPKDVVKASDTIELRTTTDGEIFTTVAELTQSKEGVWIGSFNPGSKPFDYQYVIVSKNGQEVPEGWAIRKFNPNEQRTFFNDVLHFLGGEVLTRNVSVTIRLTLVGLTLNGESPKAVGVMGSYGELSWSLPDGVKHLHQQSNGVWEASIVFPKGTTTDFPIKFVWEYDGVWYWESLPGFVDHLLILEPRAGAYIANFTYNPATQRVEAESGTGVLVDDYAFAAQEYGGFRNYEYYRAKQLIDLEDYSGAQTMYARYRNHYRETFNDDFHGYLSSVLQQRGQSEQALTILEEWYNKELDPYRRAHYRYLKGRVLLNGGKHKESRQAMQEVLNLAPEYDEEAIRGHALRGLGLSYQNDPDESRRDSAAQYFGELAFTHPKEQMRREGWQGMASMAKKNKDIQLLGYSMRKLQETGSSRQRIRSRLEWIDYRLKYTQADSAVGNDIQWLEWTLDENDELLNETQLLKADFLFKTGKRAQAIDVLERLELKSSDKSAGIRARGKLKQFDPSWERNKRSKKASIPESQVMADSTGGNR